MGFISSLRRRSSSGRNSDQLYVKGNISISKAHPSGNEGAAPGSCLVLILGLNPHREIDSRVEESTCEVTSRRSQWKLPPVVPSLSAGLFRRPKLWPKRQQRYPCRALDPEPRISSLDLLDVPMTFNAPSGSRSGVGSSYRSAANEFHVYFP